MLKKFSAAKLGAKLEQFILFYLNYVHFDKLSRRWPVEDAIRKQERRQLKQQKLQGNLKQRSASSLICVCMVFFFVCFCEFSQLQCFFFFALLTKKGHSKNKKCWKFLLRNSAKTFRAKKGEFELGGVSERNMVYGVNIHWQFCKIFLKLKLHYILWYKKKE